MAEDCACSCCCSSSTVLHNTRIGGLHPEHVNRDTYVLLGAESDYGVFGGRGYQLIVESCHIVGLSIFADPNNTKDTPEGELKGVSVTFYTTSDPDTFSGLAGSVPSDLAQSFATIYLKPGESYTFGEDFVGVFADQGLFARVIGNRNSLGADRVSVNVTWVERLHYTPAYQETDDVLQRAWNCWSDDDFLEGYYHGDDNDIWEENGSSGGTPGGANKYNLGGPGGSLSSWERTLQLEDETGDYIEGETLSLINFETSEALDTSAAGSDPTP